ncbi:MAG: OB-fold nucleic acid binding domain-containing protein [Candidatus Goldiibacteriota bacterium]
MKQLSTKEFLARIGAVTLSGVILLFCANVWIVKPLQKKSAEPEPYNFSGYAAEKKAGQERTKTVFKKDKKIIDWKNAAGHIGEYVEVKGKIVSAYNSGKVCFLNFHKDYMNHLTLVVFASDYKRFPDEPDRIYSGETVKAEGRIKLYKGRVEIIVKSPDQIKVIN